MNMGGGGANASAMATAVAAARLARAPNSLGLQPTSTGIQIGHANGSTTQLQQRAAAAAQYLNSGQRKPTHLDVQMMLEKNDAALRAWSYLHTQQPAKHLVAEHRLWAQKCQALRQQIGVRLEVLASLADKQIARDDSSAKSSLAAATSTATSGAAAAAVSNNSTATAAAVQQKKPIAAARPKTAPKPSQPVKPVVVAPMMQQQMRNQHMNLNTGGANGGAYPGAQPTTQAQPTPVAQNQATFFANASVSAPIRFPTSTGTTSATVPTTVASSQKPAPTRNYAIAPNSQGFPGNVNGIMGGAMQPNNGFMAQQNFMMNNAMNMAAMNPQFMAMQMAGQMPMAINAGANGMYNPNMFQQAAYMGMNNNQLPTDPFNASFQMQPQGGFNPAFNGMQVGGFAPMQGNPMMMNAMAFNMRMNTQSQQQQQFQQNPMMQPTAFSSAPQQQQVQQQQAQRQHQQQQQQQQLQQTQQSQPQQTQSPNLFPDDEDANIFDGFSEDSFLNME